MVSTLKDLPMCSVGSVEKGWAIIEFQAWSKESCFCRWIHWNFLKKCKCHDTYLVHCRDGSGGVTDRWVFARATTRAVPAPKDRLKTVRAKWGESWRTRNQKGVPLIPTFIASAQDWNRCPHSGGGSPDSHWERLGETRRSPADQWPWHSSSKDSLCDSTCKWYP